MTACQAEVHPEASLREAVEATLAVTSAEVSIRLDTPVGIRIDGEGVVDFQAHQGEFLLRRGDSDPLKVRYEEDAAAYRLIDEWWGSTRGEDFGLHSPYMQDLGLSDAHALLMALRDADSVAVHEAGGARRATYTGTVPVTAVTVRSAHEFVAEDATADVTVTTEASGRIVRLVCTVDALVFWMRGPGGEPSSLPTGALTTVVTQFSDFGVDVDVVMPTAVRPMSEFPAPDPGAGLEKGAGGVGAGQRTEGFARPSP